jgi:MFS family permease
MSSDASSQEQKRIPGEEPFLPQTASVGSINMAIYLAAASMFAATTARLFLLPLYGSAIGLDRAQIGWLFSSYTLAACLLSLPAGILVDRAGKTFVLWFSVLVTAITQVAIIWTTWFPALLLLQFVGGLGMSASMATLMAALSESVPEARLGRAMGWLTFSNQTGYLAGPAISALGLYFLSIHGVLTASALLCLAAAPLLLNARFPAKPRKDRRPIWADIAHLGKEPTLVPLVVAMFAATLLWGTLEAYLPLLGRDNMGLSNIEIGLVMAIQAAVNGLSRVPIGRFIDRVQHRNLLVAGGTILYALMIVVLPHLRGLPAAILLILSVIAIATAFVALATSFGQLGRAEAKGATMGLYVAILYAGLATGPALFGRTIETSGFVVGFAWCGGTAAALAIAAAVARWLVEGQQEREGGEQKT